MISGIESLKKKKKAAINPKRKPNFFSSVNFRLLTFGTYRKIERLICILFHKNCLKARVVFLLKHQGAIDSEMEENLVS